VVWGLPNLAVLFQQEVESWGSSTLGTPLDLDPYADLYSGSISATSCSRFDQRSGATTDHDFIEDYTIIRHGYRWDPNMEARQVNMVGCSVNESRNPSSKYLMIRGSVASTTVTPN
jgi:hypothetical protein